MNEIDNHKVKFYEEGATNAKNKKNSISSQLKQNFLAHMTKYNLKLNLQYSLSKENILS